MRRFELVAGTSSKFWQVTEEGTDLHISWGRLGTDGRSQTKSFPTAAAAAAAAAKLVAEKTGKGYVEVTLAPAAVGSDADTEAPGPAAATSQTETPAPAAPEPGTTTEHRPGAPRPAPHRRDAGDSDGTGPAPTPPVARAEAGGSGATPPWEPVPAPEVDLSRVWPRRGRAGTRGRRPPRERPVLWAEAVGERCDLVPGGERWQAATRELLAAQGSLTEPTLSPDALAVAVLALVVDDGLLAAPFIAHVRDRYGTAALVTAVLAALTGLGPVTTYDERARRWRTTVEDDPDLPLAPWYPWEPGSGWMAVGAVLAEVPDDEYETYATWARAAWPSLNDERRLLLTQLFWAETDLVDELGRGLLGASDKESAALLHALVGVARDPEVLAAATRARGRYSSVWESSDWCEQVLADHGADAVARLAPGAKEDEAGEALARIGRPDAVTALARAAGSGKAALARLTTATERWPAAAIAALAPVVAAGGKAASLLQPLLAGLVAADRSLTEQVRGWVDGPGSHLLDRLLAQLAEPLRVATADELPPVLASPPWLGPGTTTTLPIVELEPVELPDVDHWEATQRAETMRAYERQAGRPGAVAAFLGCRSSDPVVLEANERAQAAAAAGDVAAFVAAVGDHLDAERGGDGWTWHAFSGEDVAHLDRPLAVAAWNAFSTESDYLTEAWYAAAVLGVDGLPGTLRLAQRRPTEHARLLLQFGSTACAPLMARCYARLKTVRAVGREWLLTHRHHAAAALVPAALGPRGEAKDDAVAALRLLGDEGHGDLVREVASIWEDADVDAAVATILALDPTHRLPSKIPGLPAWWRPAAWQRPALHSGAVLGDAALDAVGVMLALPRRDGVYAGIAQVRQACTPESLAAFAWDVFSAWLAAGAPAKESWALTSLGLLGDDDTARRLTPLIRAWPGESQHARAVAGLDVLAGIGSDVALMLLDGIARQTRYQALQEHARQRIQQVADDRGLAAAELADRLAPDLGLDAQGTMRLDFGPRWFEVGFDEALAPFVRDATGTRLKDLPRPRQSDDRALAADAAARWRRLKQDARTVAAQQVARFEVAMCDQRRWVPDAFVSFLVRHPLVRHVVRRLVWGAYAPDPAHPNRGGTLQAVFRVDEDGALTTAADDPYELPPDLVVGVVHPVHLDPGDAAAMGRLLADYEIVQPFGQLDRDSHALTESERASTRVARWPGREVDTRRVLGLLDRGWRRGEVLDNGWVGWLTRDLPDGHVAYCNLDPGLVTGMHELEPVQQVRSLTLDDSDLGTPRTTRFEVLDPVTASELVRDVERLTDGP